MDTEVIEGLDNPRGWTNCFPGEVATLRKDVDLMRSASAPFDLDLFLAGRQSPVFFGSGINNFGVQEILQALIDWAPPPCRRATAARATCNRPKRRSRALCSRSRRTWIRLHRDRIAFFASAPAAISPA